MADKAPEPVIDSEYEAKMFIYTHESGNNPKSINQSGCVGLGQDCNGVLDKRCPNLDYGCEDIYFTEYMKGRYNTWSAAKVFWLARVPIDGKDVGNWW